jgi:hypothetical protein
MMEGSGAGSVLVTNGSGRGSGRPKNIRILGSGSPTLIRTMSFATPHSQNLSSGGSNAVCRPPPSTEQSTSLTSSQGLAGTSLVYNSLRIYVAYVEE